MPTIKTNNKMPGFWATIDIGEVGLDELASWFQRDRHTIYAWRKNGISLAAQRKIKAVLGLTQEELETIPSLSVARARVAAWRRKTPTILSMEDTHGVAVAAIRQLRNEQDLSVRKLCNVLNLNRTTIQKWVRPGARSRSFMADSVCEILGMTREELAQGLNPDRLEEVGAKARRLANAYERKINRQTAGDCIIPAINRMARKLKDHTTWTVRSCLCCGKQYQVGSLTSCFDCIISHI